MMDAKDFIRVLREAGLKPKSYSGRCMYGSVCVSINTDDLFTAGVSVGVALAERGRNEVGVYPRYDSMGMDSVVYWPSFKWPKDEVATSGEDDDDQ